MSNLNTPENQKPASSDADALYASLLDDIGIHQVPGSPVAGEGAGHDATPVPGAPDPDAGSESDFPRTPSVSRSSFVAPENQASDVTSSPAQLPPPGVGAPAGPSSDVAATDEVASAQGEPAMFTPRAGESAPRSRPSFDDILYGTSSAHSASL